MVGSDHDTVWPGTEARQIMMQTIDTSDQFRDAIHVLCSGLHHERCDPSQVVLELPFHQWWELQCSLARKYGRAIFDGRGELGKEFRYMGITFRAANG